MHDVAEFLKAQEPFSALDEADLERLRRLHGHLSGPKREI
jgi:hypothetical protein